MTGRGYNGTSVLNASPHWAVRREPREGGIPMRGIADARLIYSETSGCRGQKGRNNNRLILYAGSSLFMAGCLHFTYTDNAQNKHSNVGCYILRRIGLNKTMIRIKRGEIYYADLSPVIGSEQGGTRPVMILQNDIGNHYSPTTVVASITGRTGKNDIPTHTRIVCAGLPRASIILLEQLRTIDKSRIKKYIGCADERIMQEVDRALIISLGIQDFINHDNEQSFR